MVRETTEEDMPSTVFVTDNNMFRIKVKPLTLDKFETKISKDNFKNNPVLRDNTIDRWIMFRTKPSDKELKWTRSDLIKAWDELKDYLFKAYKV